MTEVNSGITEGLQCDSIVGQLVDDMTLMDDDLMSMVLDGNLPVAERLLRIILEDDEIEVVSVTGQKEFNSPLACGRNIKLDVLIKDRMGRHHNVEVQRDGSGANERRARFHSSMLDSRMLHEGQKFKEIRDSYVIFITEKDYFGGGLPLYTIERNVEELKKDFNDGSHIIYVNGSYRGNDPIGWLMNDFSCKDADDMYYPELADSVRHFKEEGGRDDMSKAVEEYAEMRAREAAVKSTIEDAVSYGMSKTQIITKVCDKYKMSDDVAAMLYRKYA